MATVAAASEAPQYLLGTVDAESAEHPGAAPTRQFRVHNVGPSAQASQLARATRRPPQACLIERARGNARAVFGRDIGDAAEGRCRGELTAAVGCPG